MWGSYSLRPRLRLIECDDRMSKIKKARSSEVQAEEAKNAAKGENGK